MNSRAAGAQFCVGVQLYLFNEVIILWIERASSGAN